MHHFKKYHFLYFSNSCIKNRTCTISLLFRWYCDNKICIVLMASTRMKVISSGCLLLFEPLAFAREGATWVRFSFGGDVWSPLRLLGSRLFLHIFYAYREFLGCIAARSTERLLEFGMGTLGQRHLREFIWCGFFWSCEHEWSDSWGLAHACNLVVWLVRVEGFWQHSFLFTKNSILPHISCMWIFANFGGSSDY